MSNEVEIIVTGKDHTSQAFKSVSSSAKEASGGLDAVGESADKGEARILGMKDTVDGLTTVMQGPGKQGMAAYLQGFADLASGVANFIIPSLKMMAAQIAKTAVGQKIIAIGTKAWAAAQWLLNAAMSANPIGLVIIAIAALVAIIIVAYKHSETFRRIAKAAFHAVAGAAKAVWNWLKKNWPMLLAILTGPIGLAVLFIVRHWSQIKEAAVNLWHKIVNVFNAIKDAIRDKIASAVEWARNKFSSFVGIFKSLPGRLRAAFSTLSSIITAPFRSAFAAVKNAWNSTLGGKGFTAPGWLPGIGGKGFHIPYLAHGGIAGGIAMVGEHGRELVRLPQGSSVIPNGTTEGILRRGGSSKVEITINSGGSRMDDMLVELLRKAIRVRGGDVQVVLGK